MPCEPRRTLKSRFRASGMSISAGPTGGWAAAGRRGGHRADGTRRSWGHVRCLDADGQRGRRHRSSRPPAGSARPHLGRRRQPVRAARRRRGSSSRPRAGARTSSTPDDLVVVRLDHPAEDARSRSGFAPTSDLRIHLAIHAARPDVQAVVHAHLPGRDGPDAGRRGPGPVGAPRDRALRATPPLPRVGRAWERGAGGRGSRAPWSSRPIRSPGAVLLERHGAVAVGVDIDQALDRLELVEVLCRTWRDALLIRAARATLGMV